MSSISGMVHSEVGATGSTLLNSKTIHINTENKKVQWFLGQCKKAEGEAAETAVRAVAFKNQRTESSSLCHWVPLSS